MTLPDERYRALADARKLLEDLANSQSGLRIPKLVRDQANHVLRHYPTSMDLKLLAMAAPRLVCDRMEPLHRMIVAHSLDKAE